MLKWFKKKLKGNTNTTTETEKVVAPESVDNTAVETAITPSEVAPIKVTAPITPAEPDKHLAPPVPVEAKIPAPPEVPAEPDTFPEAEKVSAMEEIPEVEEVPEAEEKSPPAQKPHSSFFSRLSKRLDKTKEALTYQMDALFLGSKEIDNTLMDSLEEILITADVGVATTEELLKILRRKVSRKEITQPEALKKLLKKQIKAYILSNETDSALVMPKKGPFVIMVIGVNGVGKTTTIGKIAHKFIASGQSVMLAAGDTFRAAAVSQLKIWGERNGVPVIAHHDGADPSSVVFDAVSAAIAQKIDVLLVDTAGRMHTKENLMEELKKIKRVMKKKLPAAPHETLLVLDATTGQNGISQAQLFDAAVDVTGLALTKLDGTSKGGIVINICREMKIPIRFIGIGEGMEDLRDFVPEEFADALLENNSY
ncbi:signal recognition particle-docking protein FtsY [Desulforhopalus vacuolatus]|uniref:signal recognition particle-docking protein FtsY n=1 Tax=Desulforhopalus vacuolatus TaxID=40414 RepID=UPI001964769A|nr:signal recognition particle-docking protein FtsY [Desulforhopalus vacuolatus]MBM9519635.1 signal recognition particle-docking protein FtsY [Desulforhopalus vacuolatus]